MRDALAAVPGVLAATLELDAAGPAVLRIRLAPGVDQEQVVGAALDGLCGLGAPPALAAGGGRLRLVGPQGQGVVAVVEASSTELAPAAPARLVLERVEVASERLQLWATVHLARGELRFSGTAGGSASSAGAHRAVAAAAARAAESALGAGVRLDVEAVDVVAVGQDRIGVVIVTLLTERGLDRLTGAALVRGDGRETIVRATLDALNRRAESRGLERQAPRA